MKIRTVKTTATGWGEKELITNNDQYCAMIVHLNKDKKSSAHYHLKKRETYYVMSGLVKVFYSTDVEKFKEIAKDHKDDYSDYMDMTVLSAGEILEIEPNIVHQVYALEDSVFLEISGHHTEADMFRVRMGD